MKQHVMKQNRGQLTENTEPKCRTCRDIGYIFIDETVEDYGYHEYAKICPVCKAGNPNDQRLKAELPQKFFTTCLPDFKFDSYSGDSEEMKKIAGSFFRDFDKWRADALGLYLWSSKRGSGKTMLACALSNSLMIKNGISVRFITVPDYLESLKRRPRNCYFIYLHPVCHEYMVSHTPFRLIYKRKSLVSWFDYYCYEYVHKNQKQVSPSAQSTP